ncbi:MAG: peptide-methionine (S)-S-oxide reductase MsrA [Sneathiella sp.]
MLKKTRLTRALLTFMLLGTSIPAHAAELSIATFAGGCFWCVEKDFEHVTGVESAVSGYTGGTLENPTYRNHGKHLEAVRIMYDPKIVSYDQLLNVFWRSVDPTDGGGQFCDRGNAYKTAIYANSEEQRKIATLSKSALQNSKTLKAPIVTPVLNASFWTDSEDYHQDYYKKNPLRYKFYRFNCGRDAKVKELWGDQAHTGINHPS